MKKILTVILIMAISLTMILMNGCSGDIQHNSEKINIVTTVFPIFDWTRNVIGDTENVDVTLLLSDGVDLHSFQPTVQDIVKISSCDIFIYIGGESDAWIEDALKEKKNEDMVVINLMDILGDYRKREEIKEGMTEEEEEGKDFSEIEYDEHVWLSLKNAGIFVKEIEKILSDFDSENKDTYSQNALSYAEKLSKLDYEYLTAVNGSKRDTVLFADRFPFRYLTDDYGLNYYAAFPGCAAESEASFETITFLANKIDELDLDVVLTTESDDFKIADTIISSSEKDAKIVKMDSMQSVTREDISNGKTYIRIMEDNLEALKQALK